MPKSNKSSQKSSFLFFGLSISIIAIFLIFIITPIITEKPLDYKGQNAETPNLHFLNNYLLLYSYRRE